MASEDGGGSAEKEGNMGRSLSLSLQEWVEDYGTGFPTGLLTHLLCSATHSGMEDI